MAALISVLMPCYNSAATLPWAIASLIGQSYEDWECIFVDDGSADHPERVLRHFADERIRCFRLSRNYGRGAARSLALEKAQGKYISMVDADDWIYPCKLSKQVRMMEEQPDMVLVTTPMAIVNASNRIIGVRGRCADKAAVFGGNPAKFVVPAISFGASMIRANAARNTGFNLSLTAAEDLDFLIRLLQGRRYAMLPSVTYAYREVVTRRRVLQDHKLVRSIHRRQFAQFPQSSSARILSSLAKSAMYQAGFALGIGGWIGRRRSMRPMADDIREFNSAKRSVESLLEGLGSSASLAASIPERLPA